MRNSTIQSLGIVGTGAMGRGIAQIAAQAGLAVSLFDTNAQAVAAARQYLQDTFAKLADKGKISAADSEAALARVKACTALEDLAGCDMVLEAIVEKLEVKRDLIARLEHKPDALVSGSAVDYYGVRGDEELSEIDRGQTIFQSQLCQLWEMTAQKARIHGVRVCMLRLGVVLGNEGELAKGLERFGRYKLERGEIEAGRGLIREAHALFQKLGMKKSEDITVMDDK